MESPSHHEKAEAEGDGETRPASRGWEGAEPEGEQETSDCTSASPSTCLPVWGFKKVALRSMHVGTVLMKEELLI